MTVDGLAHDFNHYFNGHKYGSNKQNDLANKARPANGFVHLDISYFCPAAIHDSIQMEASTESTWNRLRSPSVVRHAKSTKVTLSEQGSPEVVMTSPTDC